MTPRAKAKRPEIGVWMILQDRKKLARLMVVQGISQRELARRAGLQTHSYIGALMRGEATNLNPKHAAAVAKVLGVGTEDLFLTELSTDRHHVGPAKGRAA